MHLGFIAKLYTENLAAGLPCSDTAEAKVELPPAAWLHLDFGDFRVAELNRMGKPWDYKLILGTDAPEFYWQLLRGETIIFSAEEEKCQPEPDFHYEQTSGYWFKYIEGDRYAIEVRENDDIKTELAGTFPLPAIRNNLPYINETLAFDQISEAHLQLEAMDFDTLSWVSGMEVKEIRIEKGQYKLLLKWKGIQPDIPYDWSAYLKMDLFYGSRNLFLMTGYEDETWSWEAGEPVNFELDKGITLTFDTLANFNPDSLRLVVDTYAAQQDRRDFFHRTTLPIAWMTPRKHVTTIAYLIVGLALLSFLVIIFRSFRK